MAKTTKQITETTETTETAKALEHADICTSVDGRLTFRAQTGVHYVIDLNTITSFRLGDICQHADKPTSRSLYLGLPYDPTPRAFIGTEKQYAGLPVVVADKLHAEIYAYLRRK